VPALEPLRGRRVVADPAALDRAAWVGERVTVLRFAPDEAFGIGATAVTVDDPDAIVEPDAGFVGAHLGSEELLRLAGHVEWELPTEPGVLAQGKIAGVPSKLLAGDPALLVTQAAYAHELAERLGWLG
jgi:hypothetical protein